MMHVTSKMNHPRFSSLRTIHFATAEDKMQPRPANPAEIR